MADYILVVAGSARMLAQAAARCGLKPLALDLFADLDTRACAADFRKVSSLAWADLAEAVAFFKARYPIKQAVYGSGFEAHPESLRQLAEALLLAGNAPAVFELLYQKAVFFSALARLAIPYPETRFTAPGQAQGWLRKPQRGQGGLGIRPYDGGMAGAGDYWQKHLPGSPHSVLFLADGHEARVVGFNRQWTTDLGAGQAFVFAGISNHADIPKPLQSKITDWLARLVPAFSLRGLNSLDFILTDEGRAYVLEINPRIPASLQLYDGRLLRHHLDTSLAPLAFCLAPKIYRAYQIVYAPEAISIPPGFIWPDGCADLLEAGVRCRKGRPICSIIAHHSSRHGVLRRLARIEHSLIHHLIR